MVSLPRSDENTPVDRTVNANTEATTTKAIKMMAVSSPVMPFWPRAGLPVNIFIGNSSFQSSCKFRKLALS